MPSERFRPLSIDRSSGGRLFPLHSLEPPKDDPCPYLSVVSLVPLPRFSCRDSRDSRDSRGKIADPLWLLGLRRPDNSNGIMNRVGTCRDIVGACVDVG